MPDAILIIVTVHTVPGVKNLWTCAMTGTAPIAARTPIITIALIVFIVGRSRYASLGTSSGNPGARAVEAVRRREFVPRRRRPRWVRVTDNVEGEGLIGPVGRTPDPGLGPVLDAHFGEIGATVGRGRYRWQPPLSGARRLCAGRGRGPAARSGRHAAAHAQLKQFAPLHRCLPSSKSTDCLWIAETPRADSSTNSPAGLTR